MEPAIDHARYDAIEIAASRTHETLEIRVADGLLQDDAVLLSREELPEVIVGCLETVKEVAQLEASKTAVLFGKIVQHDEVKTRMGGIRIDRLEDVEEK